MRALAYGSLRPYSRVETVDAVFITPIKQIKCCLMGRLVIDTMMATLLAWQRQEMVG